MKGAGFEREIAVALSEWWSDGKRSDIFYRSQASGARFTSRKKSGKDTALQSGDITASDPVGEPLIKEWSIELKTGYGKKTDTGVNRWDSLDFLDSRQSTPVLQKMWDQCYRDARIDNKEPILIFRRNNRAPCIMFRTRYLLHLEDFFGDYLDYHLIIKTSSTINCVIMLLKQFFLWIPNIRSALKKVKPTINIRR